MSFFRFRLRQICAKDSVAHILLRLQGVCKGFVHLGLHLRGWLRLPQIKVKAGRGNRLDPAFIQIIF